MGVDARLIVDMGDYESVEWFTGLRWFSADYPRGHWPSIRERIDRLLLAFPDRPVYYAPDWSHQGTRSEQWLLTPERLQELDDEWTEWVKENPNGL